MDWHPRSRVPQWRCLPALRRSCFALPRADGRWIERKLLPRQPALPLRLQARSLTMSTTRIEKSRTGKIARLPRTIRDALNLRLMDGMEGGRLLAWLNAQVEVQEVLRNDFASIPVSRQNLSQWRLGGYQDWLRQQETCERVRLLSEKS